MKEQKKSNTKNASLSGDDLKELSQALNNLATALNRTSDTFDVFKNKDDGWRQFPIVLSELNKRLMTLCTRL